MERDCLGGVEFYLGRIAWCWMVVLAAQHCESFAFMWFVSCYLNLTSVEQREKERGEWIRQEEAGWTGCFGQTTLRGWRDFSAHSGNSVLSRQTSWGSGGNQKAPRQSVSPAPHRSARSTRTEPSFCPQPGLRSLPTLGGGVFPMGKSQARGASAQSLPPELTRSPGGW